MTLDDAHRDAVALTLCVLRGDQAGADAIIAGAEPGPLMFAMGELIGEALAIRVRAEGCPPELVPQAIEHALTTILQQA